MSHYKPYPAYKDSGVEWIGLVPEHWKVAQIKRISALNPKKSTLSEEKDSLCTFLPMEKLRTNAITLDETRPIHEVYDGYSYFCDDDILIAKVTPCFENGNIAVANGLVNGIGFGSTEINVLRVNGKGHNRFLYYRLQEEQFRTIAKSEMRGTGGLKRVPTELFESFTFGLPDTDEQVTIAATLDRETARIDALVEKKTRFIELLKEKRQALITHAVTKGLDRNAKMKDSGIEWIGQVPEHWEVKPICRVTSVNDDVLPDSTTDDTPIRYVDISSVGYMEGIKQASDMCFADAPSRARRKASSGDVIISTVRTYLKAVAAVTDEYADCVFSTGFAVLRARHLDRSFLKWMVLNELLIQAIEAHSEGLSYPAINASALVKLKSVIPPPEEQASIAATLDRETARIDALMDKAKQSITLLKERRAAFITAAVTGQIDLRGK
ncbi:restriction endonuclease subunit S [Klebsiella pneumoniae]|uniref:restriction endonuclease subunit S n=1 Tax=Klebsiella pneumoniae complex TaxID=3390273 RepID=UPI00292C0C09|nr:restriction endonuclease subunit S [Klebsiella pneumoniae]EBF7223106.1 restriction endonuclease subunit S [Salmonella enterica]MDV0977431.1 restriction endonuclease subunit S [Klebsiella pneumoniae]